MTEQFDFVKSFSPEQNDEINYAISSVLRKIVPVLGDLQELQIILNNAVQSASTVVGSLGGIQGEIGGIQGDISGIQGDINGINASLGDFIEQTDAELDALKAQIGAVDAKIPPIVEDINTLTSDLSAAESKITEIESKIADIPDLSAYFTFLSNKTISKKPFDVTGELTADSASITGDTSISGEASVGGSATINGTATAGTLKSANLTSPTNRVTCNKIFNTVDSVNVDNSGGYARLAVREGTNPYTESDWTCFGCAIGSGTYPYDPALYVRGQKRRIQTATNNWT